MKQSQRSGPDPHILVVGPCWDMPARLWALRARVAVSAITTLAGRADLTGAGEYTAVEVVPEDAGVAASVAAAEAVQAVRPITGVVSFTDAWMEHAAAIVEQLDCAGHRADTVRAVHHKPTRRERLRTAGVEDVASLVARSAAEVVDFGERHGWPVVLKPGRGTGSLGVVRVGAPAEATTAFRWTAANLLAASDGVLVEQYLVGDHYAVESFAEDGEFEIVTITKNFVAAPRMVQVGYLVPAVLEPATAKSLTEHVVAALTAAGMRDGPAVTEVRLTAAGPRTMESQLRLDGDDFAALIATTFGVDLADLWARQLLGQRVLPRLRRQLAAGHLEGGRVTAMWWAYPDAEGTLTAIVGLDKARRAQDVVDVVVKGRPGCRVQRLASSDSRLVKVRAEHHDAVQALRSARTAAERITFVITTAGRAEEVL